MIVFNIQSLGAVNFKSLINTGDGSYNPIIKKFFKFFDHDVGATTFLNLNEFFKTTLNLMLDRVIWKQKRSDNALVNSSKRLKKENTILNEDDN